MATPGSSRRPDGKRKEHHDSPCNLSGLKHQLHGTSYQVKLGIVVSLANAKKILNPNEKFSFTVTAEDRTAGKFDDIVYAFQHGDITGTLKIQAKHKLSPSTTQRVVQHGPTTAAIHGKHKQESSVPKITLNDFIVDSKNDFCLHQYFKSFLKQPQKPIEKGLEGLLICTNADLDDDANVIWNEIDTVVLGDSTTSLDSYISSLFDKAGGKCYQLKTHYKRAALVRLLINAIKSKEAMVTWQRPLLKEYRAAILDIIDKESISGNVSLFKLTDDFLDPTYSNSKPGYEAFRKEFKEQFQREFGFTETAWDCFKRNIPIYVAENFLLDEKNPYPSSDSFPDDNEEESFKAFCNRFRLVCGTYNEQGLDDTIVDIWRNLYFGDEHLNSDRQKDRVQENMVTEKLFISYFNWLKDPFADPLHSDDIKKDLDNIETRLAYIKLKVASDKLCEKNVASPFRLRPWILSESYECIKSKSFQEFNVYDIRFGITVLSDMMDQQANEYIFIEDHEFVNALKKKESIFPSLRLYARCLIIICQGMSTVPVDMLQISEMQIFLIKKSSSTQSKNQAGLVDLNRFRICDLTEESWNQFLGKTIPLCSTTIFPAKIFQNSFQEIPIVAVIKILDWGKQMENNNEISKKYREIESTYVHRPWVDLNSKLVAENIKWKNDAPILKSIRNSQQEGVSFNELTKILKTNPYFDEMFGKPNNPEKEYKPIIGDESKKVLILLGEAGLGKTTNLTWLAWHLRKRNPSSWVVRCNLFDHCIDFNPFLHAQDNGAGKVINETEALRMLYKLVHSSIQLKREMAEKCSKCLNLSDGEVTLNGNLVEEYGLLLNCSIMLLVFKEKFNTGELVLLLDGFDEIAPDYKEVLFELLSYFEQFEGVWKLYLTSRPYGFKEHFEKVFKDLSFFKLKPLALLDKESILYKMMKDKWHNGNNDEEASSNFYKSMCYMIICSLDDMSDVPLNLMMAVEILEDRVYYNESINIKFSSKSFSRKLLELIVDLSKASFIVEEFVKVKIRHVLYDKNGVDKNVAAKPFEKRRFEKAFDEVKLLHGLVAFLEIFSVFEVNIILSASDISEVDDYIKKIREGSEKTGIINGFQHGVPIFIHRTFAEYLAAWWIVKQQIEGNHRDRKNIFCLESFWDSERKELRENIDTILAKHLPLHLAIIERDWGTVESLLSTNQKLMYQKDDGNRTPLHLLALYYDIERDSPHFLVDSIASGIINCTDTLFGWTALDFAFHRDKPHLIFYLLHHGAAINVDVLYGQVASARKDKILKAAKYARYVMEYLSSQGIEYESHDASRKTKIICDKVVTELFNATSANFTRTNDRDCKNGDNNEHKEISFITDVIMEDSVWMLESIIQQAAGRKHFFQMIRNAYFDLEQCTKSMLLLKCFMAKDPFILHDDILWHCIVLSVTKNHKEEFKYFFDLYCSRSKIKAFKPCTMPSIQSDSIDCSIQSDIAGRLIDYVENNVKRLIADFINNMYWSKLGIPTAAMIDEKLLSLLVICVATVRPSMLRYLIESFKLNLCAGLVYSLAMMTNHLFLKAYHETAIKPNQAYACLLDLSSNISDSEANKMLRLAILSNLFGFSKCLIERYKIDFLAVDEVKGWNVFHLCVSNQRSFWIEQKASDDTTVSFVDDDKTDLFRCMLEKASDTDCFGMFDKKGRSILHIAVEYEQRNIVEHIVARKLRLNNLDELENIEDIDVIPNITFCYLAIHEISKSVEKKEWHCRVLWKLAKRIAKISLTNCKESQGQNSSRLLLQENAKELYEIAKKCNSLFLMYYLYREFPSPIPTMIYDADWIACTAKSLYSKVFFDVTKWLINPKVVEDHVNLYEVFEKCDDQEYDLSSVNLEQMVKQVEEKLSTNRSVEEVCKLKLLAVAVHLKHELMVRNVCETLYIKIDWKDLMEIVHMAHQSYKYHAYLETSDFERIYEYLFERTSNLGETDAEGANVLHLATQYGLGCMAKFLIKHNMVNVMATNEKNGWNIFHYYASIMRKMICCIKNDCLLDCIIKRVLESTSDVIWNTSLTNIHKNKLNELCFNSNGGRKSVIHVAVETGNIYTAEYIIKCRLGIDFIELHKLRNIDEYSHFRQCYDELSQIATQLPFNGDYDYLLHRLAKSIHRISPVNYYHITEQANVEDACRTAIKYRLISELEHLIISCEGQIYQVLARSTSNELIACMMECIRRNRTSLFKALVGHCRFLQDIQPGVKREIEWDKNTFDDTTIDERKIQWPFIYKIAKDVITNRYYVPLFILSVAYGRLLMTQSLVEMLQLEVKKSLIVLIMKVLKNLWNKNCNVAAPVYEYLASRCKGNPNALHLCVQAGCYNMLKYLIKERKHNPNEIDSENGWNAGHYCVSDPRIKSGYEEFTWLVEENDMDCFGVYDQNGRSILHLALENDHTRVVEYIINHRLGFKGDNRPWYEWDLEKINKQITELQHIIKSLPEDIPHQQQQVIYDVLEPLVFYTVTRASANIEEILDHVGKKDNEPNEEKQIEDVTGRYSFRMQERGINQEAYEKLLFRMIKILFSDLAIACKSNFVLKYFMATDSSILNDDSF